MHDIYTCVLYVYNFKLIMARFISVLIIVHKVFFTKIFTATPGTTFVTEAHIRTQFKGKEYSDEQGEQTKSTENK